MNYLGGKYRQGKNIAKIIGPCIRDKIYVEPFCGALGSSSAIAKYCVDNNVMPSAMILSDVQRNLINTWSALMSGWDPPEAIPEQLYQEYKNKKDQNDPLDAYIGYGMSFGGKYWGGYARDKKDGKRLYAANLKRSCILKINCLKKIELIKMLNVLNFCVVIIHDIRTFEIMFFILIRHIKIERHNLKILLIMINFGTLRDSYRKKI